MLNLFDLVVKLDLRIVTSEQPKSREPQIQSLVLMLLMAFGELHLALEESRLNKL